MCQTSLRELLAPQGVAVEAAAKEVGPKEAGAKEARQAGPKAAA